jgi:hypothetical protein
VTTLGGQSGDGLVLPTPHRRWQARTRPPPRPAPWTSRPHRPWPPSLPGHRHERGWHSRAVVHDSMRRFVVSGYGVCHRRFSLSSSTASSCSRGRRLFSVENRAMKGRGRVGVKRGRATREPVSRKGPEGTILSPQIDMDTQDPIWGPPSRGTSTSRPRKPDGTCPSGAQIAIVHGDEY